MSDEQNHNRPLEEELKDFPEYDMKSAKVNEIYDHLLNEANQLDIKDKRRKTVSKVAVALTSVAAVLIIALVSMNMLDDNAVQYNNDAVQNNENSSGNSDDAGDFDGSTDNDADTDEEGNEDGNESDLSEEEIIKNKAKEAMTYLADRDMEALSNMTHEDQGVLFSPYVNIAEDAQVFNGDQIENFMNDSTVYHWGIQDGSGHDIELTPEEYFDEYVYNKDYKNADKILYEAYKDRGNIKNNINETFPESKVVEYYIEPSKQGGNDWGSLNLVFEQNSEDQWKLVAIVHDQWTI